MRLHKYRLKKTCNTVGVQHDITVYVILLEDQYPKIAKKLILLENQYPKIAKKLVLTHETQLVRADLSASRRRGLPRKNSKNELGYGGCYSEHDEIQ